MVKRTVLVVDDQVINRKILHKLLATDYNVLEAGNGEEALAVLRSHEDDISAVLLDIVMPVMDGYQVLDTMREDTSLSKIPVIVSSQKDGDENEVKALALGAQDFISKPYKADIIRHRLSNIIKLRETAAIVNRAERDELTGIYNKTYFISSVEEFLHKHPEERFDLLCLGIERFKLINDSYGTQRGDDVLRYIGGIAQEISEDTGLCSRFVADMFYMLVPHEDEYTNTFFKIWNEAINQFPIEMEIKLHWGVYNIKDINAPVSNMCDRALLAAEKNVGSYNECFTLYDDELRQKLIEEQQITGMMQQAIDQRQFQVYYQPKYELATESIAGAEALVRWIHPEKGFMSPGTFIPIFERNGFITNLDRYVWEQVCIDLHEWIENGGNPVPVSVNVSRADIFNPHLAEILTGLIQKYEIPIKFFHLEITESAYTNNPDQIISTVKNLRSLGFVIEMDDFGSGYSSLNMLAEMPVDILKMDMRFVQNEAKHTSGKGIMSFVISLAKWMKLMVVAEGVETAEQIASLRSMDCNLVQGFYYAKPMPKDSFVELLRTSAIANPKTKLKLAVPDREPEHTNSDRIMLIVDDIEVNRAVLGEIFASEYQIVEKENGKEALEFILQNYPRLEIVLLDLLMPVMDGFQLMEKMQNMPEIQDIPIVITSQGDEAVEEKALLLGAQDFISKPYNPQIVHHRVHNVLNSVRNRRSTAEELDKVHKREQALLNSIPGGLGIYHLKKDGSLTTEYVSEGVASICGYTVKEYMELVKDNALACVLPECLHNIRSHIEKSIKNNNLLHDTYKMQCKDRTEVLVNVVCSYSIPQEYNSEDRAIFFAVHTKVGDTEVGLYGEQARYRAVLDNLDIAYFELDGNGEFYASDKFSLYTISEEDIDNINYNTGNYESVYKEDLPKLFSFFAAKNSKAPKAKVTLRMKMKDGSYRWTEMLGFFEYDDKGNRIKTVGVLQDVDKEWQQQNARLSKALEDANKANNAKTAFLARVSHEMRTPLNDIMGLSSLMVEAIKEDVVDVPKLKIELEQLRQSGSYLLNLINDTIDVSKIERGTLTLNPVVCDGKTAFKNVISMVEPSMIAKQIKFNLEIGKLPFTQLYIDVGRGEQALMNVLSNAIKFTPVGGTITMKMDNISYKDGVITDRIIIEDNGIGMEPDFIPHAFEPFAQEEKDSTAIYKGTGLGLTIAKQCIELMGGSIAISSVKGKGTTITLIVPMAVATAEQIIKWRHNSDIDAKLKQLIGKKVLLCEDHPLNATITINLLTKIGVHCDLAHNGKVGVELFTASHVGEYDAILMDLRMPVMDGLEATRHIRALDRPDADTVPIIALTANAFTEDIKNAIDAGMNEHLPKPIDPDRLYKELADFILLPQAYAGCKVLIVDDLEINRALVRSAIKNEFQTIEAGNGQEALEQLKNNTDVIAVITDIQMPVMDGEELILAIRADRAFDKVAILANTNYGDYEQEEHLLNIGANDFVYKPSTPRVIMMRLKHILHKW